MSENKQPKALQLADEVDEVAQTYPDMAEVSSELCRLHSVNTELLEALIGLRNAHCDGMDIKPINDAYDKADAAIAKATTSNELR